MLQLFGTVSDEQHPWGQKRKQRTLCPAMPPAVSDRTVTENTGRKTENQRGKNCTNKSHINKNRTNRNFENKNQSSRNRQDKFQKEVCPLSLKDISTIEILPADY